MDLTFPVYAGLGAAALAAFAPVRAATAIGCLTAAVLCVIYASFGAQLGSGAKVTAFWGVSDLGVTGGLKLDGWAIVFALLITGIGALIFLFTEGYLPPSAQRRRLVVLLLLFMTSMLGAVTADDVIVLFIFWELTSLTSFFLVGYDHTKDKARKAALQALLVTVGGGLALLAGLLLIALAAGTTSLTGIIANRDAVLAHPAATSAMLLVILGCFTKSAQVPFHFWLPNAMAAPTPVSAYLHSATMVKLGIYLLGRLNPIYQTEELWRDVLTYGGAATALTGALLAFREIDLKRMLACTTITGLGTLVMLIGIAPELSITAAVTFLIVHAFYKASLFMIAGIIDHETGTRDASSLHGLRRTMPITAIAAGLAAFSMAGLPPFVGFVAKELVYEAKLELGPSASVLIIAGFVVNAATVAIAGVLSWRLFFGTPRQHEREPHDPSPSMLIGPMVLALLGLAAGGLPAVLGSEIIEPAAAAILGKPVEVQLKLWHGFNAVLALSAATVMVGVVIYLGWARIVPRLQAIGLIERYGPSAAYDRGLQALLGFGEACTRMIQHGSLRGYVRTLFAVVATATLGVLLMRGGMAWPSTPDTVDPRVASVGLILLGAGAVMAAPTPVTAALALGLVGFGTAIVFLTSGAPDVAFTQFAVETLMVVILATALSRLPIRGRDLRTMRQKLGDLGLALFCGISVAAVLAAVLASPFDTRLSDWFGQQSVPAAHGRNVVNVILVDFRALDTLGEITVLALAAFAVVALLRRASADAASSRNLDARP